MAAADMTTDKFSALSKMRAPFTPETISKLPKGSKALMQCPDDQKITCKVCGGWHHPKLIHLDYVGHAAITARLLEVDPLWYWEPFAIAADGLPAMTETGGLWIRLHVAGMSRIGYGDATGRVGSANDAIKEAIGDAIRNAAMRFGAALELWHKGDSDLMTTINEPDEAMVSIVNGLIEQVNACETPQQALELWKLHHKALVDDPPLYQKFRRAVAAKQPKRGEE